MSHYKIIISGGGTGGHIFPAIAIANAFRRRYPDAEVLFVGAEGRMEMERVPAAGYRIIGLPVSGLDRRRPWRNIGVMRRLWVSLLRARTIVSDFQPDVAVGVGGYASGPLLRAAEAAGVPTLIQEQNSYAGITNKWLAKRAARICVAYPGMERFFPAEKIVVTGNPVRKDLEEAINCHDEALKHFGLDPACKTLLVLGGSLGARTINEAVEVCLPTLADLGVQLRRAAAITMPSAAVSPTSSRSPSAGSGRSSRGWITPMPRPTSSCRVPEPARSPSCVCWVSPPSLCRRLTWRKIIRRRTPDQWPIGVEL